jgi:hypothetical protein
MPTKTAFQLEWPPAGTALIVDWVTTDTVLILLQFVALGLLGGVYWAGRRRRQRLQNAIQELLNARRQQVAPPARGLVVARWSKLNLAGRRRSLRSARR